MRERTLDEYYLSMVNILSKLALFRRLVLIERKLLNMRKPCTKSIIYLECV